MFQFFVWFDEVNLYCPTDFVDNLIKNRRHIGAVRFISAYNLSDKSRLVSIMLQLEVYNEKQISYEVVGREKHREPKVLFSFSNSISLTTFLVII